MNKVFGYNSIQLLDALERLHAHGMGSFRERLFEATRLLYRDTRIVFEAFSQEGCHYIEMDASFPTCYTDPDFAHRIEELVRAQHPGFKLIAEGRLDIFRMSDLMSQRKFRRTDLYNEVFLPVSMNYQLALPFQCEGFFGALTINRGDHDFSDKEKALSIPFAKHAGIAFYAHTLFEKIKQSDEGIAPPRDYIEWRRRGLTLREYEVLDWMTQGKRDAEIAIILGISLRTVHVHVRAILAKLGVENRTAAATVAASLLK